jgi:hypothetical protein
MGKSKKIKERKRCIITNKVLEGKDAVLTDHAEEYLKKMGYEVIKPKQKKKENLLKQFFIFIFLFGIIFFIPLINAQSPFDMDLSLESNFKVIYIVGIIALILFIYQYYTFCSIILIIIGFIFLVNDINVIICVLIICLGIFIAFREVEK